MVRFVPGRGVPVAFCMVAAAVLSLPYSGASAQTDGFKVLKKTKDGITVSRKAGRTKGFYVTRFDAVSPVSADHLADKVWEGFFTFHPPVQERRFLKKEPNDLVFYDKVRTPVVSDRDYTMRIRRINDGDVRRMEFQTTTEFGPPPDPKYVRMPFVKGYWNIFPDGQGGSIVRYEVYSEPGGSIPALIVKEAQTDEALGDFRRALSEARR